MGKCLILLFLHLWLVQNEAVRLREAAKRTNKNNKKLLNEKGDLCIQSFSCTGPQNRLAYALESNTQINKCNQYSLQLVIMQSNSLQGNKLILSQCLEVFVHVE